MGEVTREYSVRVEFCCGKLQLDPERYWRWVSLHQRTGRYGDGKPGPVVARHALLPEERAEIIELSRDEAYTDLSHRQLAVLASEAGQVQASPSSFYRVMKEQNLMERRICKPREPQKKPEVKPTKPNEIWPWGRWTFTCLPSWISTVAR